MFLVYWSVPRSKVGRPARQWRAVLWLRRRRRQRRRAVAVATVVATVAGASAVLVAVVATVTVVNKVVASDGVAGTDDGGEKGFSTRAGRGSGALVHKSTVARMTVLWGRAVAVTGTAARRCSLAGAVPRCVLSPRRPQQQQKGRQRRLAWCCTETPTSGNGQERRRRRNRYSDSVSSDSRSDPKGQQQQQLLLAPPQSGRRRRRREESGSGWTVSDEAAGYGRPEAESMWGAGQEFDEATERRIERVRYLLKPP